MADSSWRRGPKAVGASALLTLFVVFVVAEIGLRQSALEPRAFALNELSVPGLIGDYFPNQRGTVEIGEDDDPHYYDFTTNSQGFRGPLVDRIRPEEAFRILAIGDSYTWGDGVGDDEVWLRILERNLATCGAVEVVNAGFVGRNTVGEADYLEQKGLSLNPDLVLVGAEPGDAMDILELDRDWDNRAAMMAGSRPGWLVRLTGWSRVWRLWFGGRIAKRSRKVTRPADAEGAWLRVRESFARMKQLCVDGGCDLVAFGIAPTPDDSWSMERLASEAAAAGLGDRWFEAAPKVDERGPRPGWWEIPGDGHYTAEGNVVSIITFAPMTAGRPARAVRRGLSSEVAPGRQRGIRDSRCSPAMRARGAGRTGRGPTRSAASRPRTASGARCRRSPSASTPRRRAGLLPPAASASGTACLQARGFARRDCRRGGRGR